MKKTSSFNLEEMTYNEIMRYKEDHNLSSRNMALEMMLLERRNMLKMLEYNSNKINNLSSFNNSFTKIEEEPEDKNNDFISNSVEDSFMSMPD